MRAAAATLGLVAALALAAPAAAAPELVPVRTDFTAPIYVTAPPRDQARLFVVERAGLVKVVDLATNAVAAEPFIDLTGVVTLQSERGLLSMAFPPDYEASGLSYTYLTGPDGQLQVREHKRSADDPNRTDAGSRLVWTEDHSEEANHNGGQIEFGPDGLLWIAPGDGGGGNDTHGYAQNLSRQLGKLLRIDPRKPATGEYTVPADNPYVGQAGLRPEIWATGLRNPYRFSFDRGTGDLFVGDVGQSEREEVTHVTRSAGLGRGGNFGWACREGFADGPKDCDPFEPYLAPVFDYETGSPRAITGGYLVRDPGLPTIVDRYVWADYFDGVVNSFSPGAASQNAPVAGLAARTNLASFGEDACGHLYVVSITRGDVERVQDGLPGACVLKAEPPPPPPPPPPLVPPPGTGSQPGSGVKPVLRVVVSGRRTALTRRRLRVAIRSDVAAAVTAGGRIRGGAGTFRPARANVRAGERRVLTLRLSRAVARKLGGVLRRRGRAIVALTVRALDGEGDVTTARPRLTLRRR